MRISLTRTNFGLAGSLLTPYLEKYLTYTHRSFKTVRFKRTNHFEKRELFVLDGQGGFVTYRGFFKGIIDLIDKNQDTYDIKDMRTPMPEPDWSAVKALGLREAQVEPFVDMILGLKKESGLVVATGAFGKSYAAMAAYAAFSSLNTIVAAPSLIVLRQLYEAFKTKFPNKDIGLVGDGHHSPGRDITVSTFNSLARCDIKKCQMLIVDEVQSTVGENIQKVIRNIESIRTLGLTATPDKTFSNSDKVIIGLFGERFVDINYEEALHMDLVVPCKCYMIDLPDDPLTYYGTDMGRLIKIGIEDYDIRNQLIGDICQQVPNGWQTLIHFDHIFHLKNFCSLLPKGSRYKHSQTSKKQHGDFSLNKKTSNQNDIDFGDNKFQFYAVSDCARVGADWQNARVIIQTAGGSSKIEILQEAFRGQRILDDKTQAKLGVDEKTHFVLVDFIDNQNEFLKNQSLKRKAIYEEAGWDVKVISSASEIEWKNHDHTNP